MQQFCRILIFGIVSFIIFNGPAHAETVLFLVNNNEPDVYDQIADNLDVYVGHVDDRFNVDVQIIADDFYNSYTPSDVRQMLHDEYYYSGNDIGGAILAGTIPYATYRHGNGDINPAPFYYEDFEAEWIDQSPADGHFEQVITDPWTNATEIWTAWWIPPAEDVSDHGFYLNGYLEKLDDYYSGQIEGEDAMLYIGSNMTNLGFNSEWINLLLESGGRTAEQIMHFGVYSSDQDLMWGYAGVPYWIYPQDLTKERYWNGSDWEGFNASLDFTPYEHPYGSIDDIKVDELFYLWNQTIFKYCHLFCHGGADAVYYHGGGNSFNYENVSLIQQDRCPNFITSSGCNNGNFRGTTGPNPAYERGIGNNLVFADNTACVTFYGSASSQSTGLFAGFHELLIQGLAATPDNYLAKGYYQMRNSDIIWGDDHYFFRSVDDKILMGNPFVTWHDSGPPTATPTPTPTSALTPTPAPTFDPSKIYLNDIYLAQYKNAGYGDNRYYQDTIIDSLIPTSGWDGGLIDLAVIEGYYDFNTGYTDQGGQIDPADVQDYGLGAPDFIDRGSIDTAGVKELDAGITILNRPSVDNCPYDADSHQDFIQGSGMNKSKLNRELSVGYNRFTIISPDAMEFSNRGIIAAFISHDPSGETFQQNDPPSVACLDDSTSQGSTSDAQGQYIPPHPGQTDAPYFQSCTHQFADDSRFMESGNYRITVTYFNVAGDVGSGMGLPHGLSGHGAPGWIVDEDIGYNSIDDSMPDCVVYLELLVEYIYTPTYGPTLTPTSSPTPTITPTETPTAGSTFTPVPTPTSPPSSLFLNDIFIVQHIPGLEAGEERFYQDSIFLDPVPSTGWDGGQMDLAVIEGYYDFGTNFSYQGAQIRLNHILDAGLGAPAFQNQGSIAGIDVAELDPSINVINRPEASNVPYNAGDHGEYIYMSGLTKNRLNHPLKMGSNRFTVLCPSAMEISSTGLLAAFISDDSTGDSFTSGDNPTVASLDDVPFQGAAADAGGHYIPCHPGKQDMTYFQPCNCLLNSDSRTTIINDLVVTISFFNVAGHVTDIMDLDGGLTGHGAPAWVAMGDIGYNSIDGFYSDSIACFEITIQPNWSPTPTASPTPAPIPAAGPLGKTILFILLTSIFVLVQREKH